MNYAYVQGGDTFTRDFVYDAAAAQGTFTVGNTKVTVGWNQDGALAAASFANGSHATLPAP